MNDKFQILKNMEKEYNREDISLKDYAVKLADDYSKVCKSNFKLQQENQKLKERINKAINYIENNYYSNNTTDLNKIGYTWNKQLIIREILKGVKDE